jgi:cytochrome P450
LFPAILRLSREEWEDNLVVLLLAGHDTSSATLTRLMANLQEHPDVLARLREEQAQVLATHGPQLTAAVLKDMVYADAVIRETLR